MLKQTDAENIKLVINSFRTCFVSKKGTCEYRYSNSIGFFFANLHAEQTIITSAKDDALYCV